MNSNKSFSSETSERYARAIFELAEENSELEKVEKNTKDLLSVYNSSIEFENYIKNPTQSFNDQFDVIKKLSDKLEFTISFKNFLFLLVEKRRIFFLKKIILSFLKLYSIKKGEMSAKLISSKNLSPEELENITKELSKAINSEINFEYKVEPELIGGFKMQIGSLMIDTSLKNKLKKYEQIMLEK
jgi:F-type H+-transporting ATPase subunit delta